MKIEQNVQNLYAEKYTTLMKYIKENLNEWKDIPCSWIERPNIVKDVNFSQISTQL